MDNKSSDDQIIKPNNTPEGSSNPPPQDINYPQSSGSAMRPSSQPDSPETDHSSTPPLSSQPSYGKPKRRWLKTLIALVIVALLAAIGWWLYQEVAKKGDQTTAPAVQNKTIDELSVGITSADYGSLYPDMPVTNSYSILANAQMFEGLVRYEEKSKIVPLLATDWTNPDDTTWEFNLKSGVMFHNGNMMQASDVKYSLDKIKNAETDFADTFASTIESVKALNEQKVQIKTAAPDPTLLNKLAFLYIIDENAPKDGEPSQAGTGPYEIKQGTKPTKTDVQMAAVDSYHGASPTTLAVNFGSAKNEDALLKDYNSGKYDIVGTVTEAKAEAIAGATQFVSSEPEVAFLGFNSVKSGPLQKKPVREAIRYAVDPVKLGAAQGGKVTPLSQLIPPSIPGYNSAIPNYERSVDRAKQLLAKAGYSDGVTLQFTYSASDNLAKELARELKEAGITLKLNALDDFGEFIDYFISGKAEMYYIAYASDTLDGVDIYQATLTSSDNYKNDEVSKLLDESAETVDPAKRLKLLQDVAVVADEDVPVVPLSTRDNLWLMNKDYDIAQDMPSSFLSVYFSKAQLK